MNETAGLVVNNADSDQMLQSTVSDLGLCGLLRPVCPKNRVNMVQNISVEKRGINEIFFLIFHEDICCGFSSEAPH